eukprot:356735-Chlamydomonas_euryale.AAC.1
MGGGTLTGALKALSNGLLSTEVDDPAVAARLENVNRARAALGGAVGALRGLQHGALVAL